MKAKWIICDIGKDAHIQSLFYGVQECGREAEVLSIKDTYELLEIPTDEKACIITSGSIGMNELRRKTKPNWVGCWHQEPLYLCSNYYSHWGKYITQKNYLMLPFAEIGRKQEWLYTTLGIDYELFFRPDSGAKEFDGACISISRFKSWYDQTGEMLKVKNISHNLICVIASPIEIFREYRLLIKDGKIITGSMYRRTGHIDLEPFEDSFEKDSITKFTEDVLTNNAIGLPPIHVIDIAVDKTGIGVLEVGCYCCAGLYSCDRRKIALAVSEAAEEEWDKKEGVK